MGEEDKAKIIQFLDYKKTAKQRGEVSKKEQQDKEHRRVFDFYQESEDRFLQTNLLPDLHPFSIGGVIIESPFRTNTQLQDFHVKHVMYLSTLAGMDLKIKKAYDAMPFAFAELLGVRSALLTQPEYIEASDSQKILQYSASSFTLFKTLMQKIHHEESAGVFSDLLPKDRAEVFEFMKESALFLLNKIWRVYPKTDFGQIAGMINKAQISNRRSKKTSIEFSRTMILLASAAIRSQAIGGYMIKDVSKFELLRGRLLDIEFSIYRLAEISDYFEGMHSTPM